MRALRFNQFGEPAVLHVADLPDPVGTAQEAVIRVEAASVNPSDVKNVAGGMDWTVLPRTPGRDFAGVVVSGPPEWHGAAVWGTGGDVGFTRDGSHAELMSVPVQALVRKPERLSFARAWCRLSSRRAHGPCDAAARRSRCRRHRRWYSRR